MSPVKYSDSDSDSDSEKMPENVDGQQMDVQIHMKSSP